MECTLEHRHKDPTDRADGHSGLQGPTRSGRDSECERRGRYRIVAAGGRNYANSEPFLFQPHPDGILSEAMPLLTRSRLAAPAAAFDALRPSQASGPASVGRGRWKWNQISSWGTFSEYAVQGIPLTFEDRPLEWARSMDPYCDGGTDCASSR